MNTSELLAHWPQKTRRFEFVPLPQRMRTFSKELLCLFETFLKDEIFPMCRLSSIRTLREQPIDRKPVVYAPTMGQIGFSVLDPLRGSCGHGPLDPQSGTCGLFPLDPLHGSRGLCPLNPGPPPLETNIESLHHTEAEARMTNNNKVVDGGPSSAAVAIVAAARQMTTKPQKNDADKNAKKPPKRAHFDLPTPLPASKMLLVEATDKQQQIIKTPSPSRRPSPERSVSHILASLAYTGINNAKSFSQITL